MNSVVKSLVFVLVAVAPFAAYPQGFMETLPDVVANIGGEELTADEFRQAVRMTEARRQLAGDQANGGRLSDEECFRVLQLLMESKALRKLARESNIEAPEDQVEQAIQEEIESAGGEEAFDALLEQVSVTREEHRQIIVEQLIQSAYAESKVQDIEVPDDELRREFERGEQAGATRRPAMAEARHILVLARGDDEAAWERARTKIEAARERIVTGGEDFAAVALEISEDPRTAQAGGALRVAGGPPQSEFERLAFELPVGEVSQPFRSQVGYHILRVDDRQAAGHLEFDEVKDALREQILNYKRTVAFRQRLKEEMEQMDIQVFVTPPARQGPPPKDVQLDEINQLLQQSS